MKVYAGYDPVSGRRHYLDAVVPAGPRAAAEAERVRTRLLHEVDEQRNPKTRATVDQLLDRYLETLDVEPTTRTRYEGIIRIYLRPAPGRLPLSKLDSDLLDRFFGQLRRCRERCNGRVKHVRHQTQREHECDDRCVVVPCRPLSASSVRQTHHSVLNARPDRRRPLALDRPQPARGQLPTPPTGEQPLAVIGARGLPPARGSLRHGSVKRVASAVSEGAICIRLVHEYLALSP